MTGQTAPRPVGLLLGLQCTLHPLLGNPVYREIAGRPWPSKRPRSRDPAFRDRLLEANGAGRGTAASRTSIACSSSATRPTTNRPPTRASPAAPSAQAVDPLDLACDLLVADDGRALLYVPFLNYRDGNLDAVGEMLAHPNTVVGLADGGAHVGTICDASFPTTLLTLWGRDRDHGRLPLPFLVHRHTQATGAHRRPARPRRARARLPRGRERHRLRAPRGAPPGDAPRPARRRQAARAERRRLRRDDRRGPGHLRARRGDRRAARPPRARAATRTDAGGSR